MNPQRMENLLNDRLPEEQSIATLEHKKESVNEAYYLTLCALVLDASTRANKNIKPDSLFITTLGGERVGVRGWFISPDLPVIDSYHPRKGLFTTKYYIDEAFGGMHSAVFHDGEIYSVFTMGSIEKPVESSEEAKQRLLASNELIEGILARKA